MSANVPDTMSVRLPTPVRLLERLSSATTSLWVKHDDQTDSEYGGNKVRKIGRLLDAARDRGCNKVVTLGAVGSHHVLTTGIFGKRAGIAVEAVLVQQPSTPHVLEVVRASVGQGVQVFPASSFLHAGLLALGRAARGAYYIPPGGSNSIGVLGFVDAAKELALQVQRGELPEPELIVVAMGSGGTAAGLVAGLAEQRLRTRVLAVTVSQPAFFVERSVRSLAKETATRLGVGPLSERLEQSRSYLGRGYGFATAEGDRATELAAQVGLTLDPTYTAKAFAAALDRVALGRERTVLYWHTLSSVPMARLLAEAPLEQALSPKVRRLAR